MKKSAIIAICAVLAVATALIILISNNVLVGEPELSVRGTPYLTGCTSVSLFGEMEITGINKVVISSDDKSLAITDEDLVKQIVDETKVARWAYNTGCGCCEQRGWKIDLYRDDKRMRSMEWPEDNIVKVYNADLTHWVLPVEVQRERSIGGYVVLSDELENKLDELFLNS